MIFGRYITVYIHNLIAHISRTVHAGKLRFVLYIRSHAKIELTKWVYSWMSCQSKCMAPCLTVWYFPALYTATMPDHTTGIGIGIVNQQKLLMPVRICLEYKCWCSTCIQPFTLLMPSDYLLHNKRYPIMINNCQNSDFLHGFKLIISWQNQLYLSNTSEAKTK